MELKTIINKTFILRAVIFAVLFVLTDLTLTTAGSYLLIQIIIDFILGVFIGFVFGIIFTLLHYTRLVRIGIAWFSLFIIQWFNNIIEGYLFTTILTESLLLFAVGFGILISFLHALFLGLLFPPKTTERSLREEMKNYFNQRSWFDWLWRFALASLLYLVIYYGIGTLISPIVLPYYLDMGTDLTVPPVWVILIVEPARGLVYILSLLPFLVSLRLKQRVLYLLLVFALYLPSIAMLIPSPAFPLILRIVHGVFEILIDSLLFTAAIILLLKSRPIDSE